MKIPKPTEADKAFFRDVAPEGAEIKPMFGNLGAFVNGNMFMGLFGPDVGIRLDDDSRAELEAIDGSGPFGPVNRPMKEYMSIPASWRTTPELAVAWAERAFDFVSSLPPKVR